ncbi:hypothetical protein Srot_0045 [Segniliparus rotundus DSM 44985]|uniref:Uncharacterized protein n=1 Tax=Segniliparus rotundus (strain ATCC BAA-972 / CDC 1076 / CIP 108378 / DSM 44985 / JCM 13578) TaxID=640132 RepID=D6Z9L1_SEGRD|nr:hypothetical protein [Segniliparus rotundus]ADG96538.1 hypothetical protein Srot_0045 [Segniliparus rotundus DSM 44985]
MSDELPIGVVGRRIVSIAEGARRIVEPSAYDSSPFVHDGLVIGLDDGSELFIQDNGEYYPGFFTHWLGQSITEERTQQ